MKSWLAFWLLGLIWGSSFLLIKIAVEELHPFPLVSIRVGIAAFLMALYLRIAGYHLPAANSDIFKIALVGLTNVALPFSLITHAEEQIDSSLATILNSTVPLFSLVIAHFALSDDRLNRYKILGLVAGYLGILMLTSRGLSNATGSSIRGQVMMLLASLCYASSVVFIRAHLRHLTPILVAGISLIFAAFYIIPFTFLLKGEHVAFTHLHLKTIAAIVTLGAVNTVIAYFFFYHLIGDWGARATMVTYTFPPIGITLGAIFLNEPVDMRLLLGAGLILLGIAAVNYRIRQPVSTQISPQPAAD